MLQAALWVSQEEGNITKITAMFSFAKFSLDNLDCHHWNFPALSPIAVGSREFMEDWPHLHPLYAPRLHSTELRDDIAKSLS